MKEHKLWLMKLIVGYRDPHPTQPDTFQEIGRKEHLCSSFHRFGKVVYII